MINLEENEYIIGIHNNGTKNIEQWTFKWFKERGFEGERTVLPFKENLLPAIKLLKPDDVSWEEWQKFIYEFRVALRNELESNQ